MIARTLKWEEVVIHKRWVFVPQRYVQHAGAGWNRDPDLWLHTSEIPDGADLKDVVAFVYGNSLRRMIKKSRRQLIDLHGDYED